MTEAFFCFFKDLLVLSQVVYWDDDNDNDDDDDDDNDAVTQGAIFMNDDDNDVTRTQSAVSPTVGTRQVPSAFQMGNVLMNSFI